MRVIASAPRPSPLRIGFVGSIGRTCFSDLLLRTRAGPETAYHTGSRQALLAALAAGRLDIAVYPGAPAKPFATALLCNDHLVVAAQRRHPLMRSTTIGAATLRGQTLLIPAEGEESDFRRLVQSLVPALAALTEAPIRDIAVRLARTDLAALVTAGQRDELGPAVVTRPIADRDTNFPVQLSWSSDADHGVTHDLLALLAENDGAGSSIVGGPGITSAGERDDDSGGGSG